MKIHELEQKYRRELIDKILKGSYLEGCTVIISKDGTEDIPEEDIIRAIKEIKGEKINPFEWD